MSDRYDNSISHDLVHLRARETRSVCLSFFEPRAEVALRTPSTLFELVILGVCLRSCRAIPPLHSDNNTSDHLRKARFEQSSAVPNASFSKRTSASPGPCCRFVRKASVAFSLLASLKAHTLSDQASSRIVDPRFPIQTLLCPTTLVFTRNVSPPSSLCARAKASTKVGPTAQTSIVWACTLTPPGMAHRKTIEQSRWVPAWPLHPFLLLTAAQGRMQARVHHLGANEIRGEHGPLTNFIPTDPAPARAHCGMPTFQRA